jgi:putative phage-type endonuclease
MSELTRSEWLVRRRSGIGGSDVAGILGLSKWRTPRDIWLSKIDTSVEIDDQPTVQQMIGTALEPHVLRLYAEQTGRSVRRSHQLLRDADDPVLIANLDARTAGRLVEIKTARNDDEWGEPGSEDIPQEYWLQVQHYMHVARVAWCDVAVMFLDKSAPDVHVYEVPRSPAYREIAGDLSRWWAEHVEAHKEPAPITSADCGRRWPQSFDREAIATSEAVVKSVMQDAERLHQSGTVLATWKTSSSSRVDLKRLRAEYPEAAAACAVETTSRRFLLKGEK